MPPDPPIETVASEPNRAPPWVVTFADLMALLMCFFVLLLSFSSMDAAKYKRIAESMHRAFGTASHEGAPLDLDVQDGDDSEHAALTEAAPTQPSSPPEVDGFEEDAARAQLIDAVAALVEQTRADATSLATALSREIAAGVLEVETHGRGIVLRVKEHGSFPPGSAALSGDFKPVLKIVRGVLKNTHGRIVVEGHTDDVPLSVGQFGSNLDLSSARAVSVAHELIADGGVDSSRFTVVGYGDTRPLRPNDSEEGRAKNRRVDVVIEQGIEGEVAHALDALRQRTPETFERVRIELMRRFELDPADLYGGSTARP